MLYSAVLFLWEHTSTLTILSFIVTTIVILILTIILPRVPYRKITFKSWIFASIFGIICGIILAQYPELGYPELHHYREGIGALDGLGYIYD